MNASVIEAVCPPHGWDSRVTRRYLLSTVPLRLLSSKEQPGGAGVKSKHLFIFQLGVDMLCAWLCGERPVFPSSS